MNTDKPNQTFHDLTEKYLHNTLTPEEAKTLLETIQNEPEKLDALSRQIQVDRLLELQNTAPSSRLITENVLRKIETEGQSKIIRPAFWNTRNISRIAASLFVLLSLTLVIKHTTPEKTDGSGDLYLADHDAEIPASAPAPVEEQPSQPQPVVRAKMKLNKPQPIIVEPERPKMTQRIVTNVRKSDMPDIELPEMSGVQPSEGFVSPQTDGQIVGNRGVGYIYPEPILNTERYAKVEHNGWKAVSGEPLSTFSIDVDTASYANIRRFLTDGIQPPVEAVRIEEMINYFEYTYPQPAGDAPFSASMALRTCPWNKNNHLLRVGLQGKKFDADEQKPSNLVFLIDASGSMSSSDKLPLLKKGFEKMVNALGENDRVAIVAYAGASGLVLPSTPASEKETLINAINRLQSGGSTAGGEGIQLAYRVAADHFIKGGVNRVILASDGDFNVGISSLDGLQKLIEEKRKTGVFLSVLGFGSGNLKDDNMEMLANKGNGNYYYIDSEREADKVLVRQLRSTLVTIAKDVKIQIEFNPALIREYRLVGYENRALENQDFADDTKDAGEIGAGHQVTALYELVPVDAPNTKDGVALKYGGTNAPAPQPEGNTDEFLTLKLRYKEPEGSASKLLTFPLEREALNRGEMDISFRWAAAVAAFGEKLRESGFVNDWSMNDIIENASGAVGTDPFGHRKECIELMKKAANRPSATPENYPQWQYR